MQAATATGFTTETSQSQVHAPPIQRYPLQFNLTLVRHPYEWLRSYYYIPQGLMVGVPTIDVLAPLAVAAQSFEEFILSYAEQEAGRYTRIIKSYHGDSVIRTEDLKPAIIELFDALGVGPYWLNMVDQLTPMPIDLDKAAEAEEIPYLQEIIQKVEPEIYEQYDYQLSGATL